MVEGGGVYWSVSQGTRKVLFSVLVVTSGFAGLPTIAVAGENKSGLTPSRIRLPKGPGSIQGLGDNAIPDLNMGLLKYTVPVEIPSGYNGLQPSIELSYNSGAGNSILGIGWSLGLASITRMTARGLPLYEHKDLFAANGGEELVYVGLLGGQRVYRNRFEKEFVRYRWANSGDSGQEGYWIADYPDGRVGYFGADSQGALKEAARTPGANGTYQYHLVELVDTLGNRVVYDYEEDGNYSLISMISYAFNQSSLPRYRIRFGYESRPDKISDGKSGVERRLRKRLTEILITSNGVQRMRHHLAYDSNATEQGRISLLQGVTRYGTDNVQPYAIHFSFEYTSIPCIGLSEHRLCDSPGWR